jgi:hypothetical protein
MRIPRQQILDVLWMEIVPLKPRHSRREEPV